MPFDPSTGISSKVLWYRAKDLGTGAVTSWPDQSGNSRNATGSGGTVATGATPSGGKALSGTSMGYSPASFGLNLTSGGELWVVLKSNGGSGPAAWEYGTDSLQSHYTYSGTVYDDFGSNARKSFTPIVNVAGWHVYRVVSNGSTWSAYQNNALASTTSSSTMAWKGDPVVLESFSGQVAEILLIGAPLSSGDASSLMDYFTAEHGPFLPPQQTKYDASAITGLSDGDSVSTWSDTSGNGYTATSAGTAAVYKTGITPSGKPVVRAVGASYYTTSASAQAGSHTIAAVVRPGTAFSDNFNRADSSSLGSPWSEVAGDASIVSNVLRFADSSSAASLCYDSALVSDDNYTQAKVTVLGNSGQSIGVFCRSDATFQNAYYFRITTTAAQIFKVVSGTLTGLGTNTSTTITAGDVLKIEAIGSTIKGYINGVQIVSVTDTSVTTGKRGGIRISAGAPSNPVRFDDFVTGDATARTIVGSTGGFGPIQVRAETDGKLGLYRTGMSFVGASPSALSTTDFSLILITASNTAWHMRVNGTEVASGGGVDYVWSGNRELLAAATADKFIGDTAEILTWESVLGSTDIALVESYLTAKWLTAGTASQSFTGSPAKVVVSTQPGSYSAGTKAPQSFTGTPAKAIVATQPGSYFAGTKVPQSFSGRPMSLAVTAQPGDARADVRIPAVFTGSASGLIVNAPVGGYVAGETIAAAFEGLPASLSVAAPVGAYATVSDRPQSYTGAPARLVTSAPRGRYLTTLAGGPLDAYTEGEPTTDGGMDLTSALGGPLDAHTEGWVDGGGDGVPFAPYSLDAYTEGWAEGRPTLTVSVDPVTGRPQYVLKVVDKDGTVVLELADAAPGVASQSLNGRGGSAFTMGAQDAQLRHVPQFKEVQLWRGGVLVPGAWWTVADPEINLNADTYGFDCPGLYYYMERRLIGKERPEYLLNGGFESGIAGWMMGWSPGSNAETPPEWELTDDAREGGQALRVFAQNRVVTTRVSRETVAMFYGNRPYASEPLSAGFMPGGEQQVRDLLEEMNPPEHSTITIEGHTADADAGTGFALSVRRAQAAREVVLAERSDLTVIAVGKGETEPVDPRHTEDAYRKNRRIVMAGTFTETKIGHRQFTQASFTESVGPAGTYEPLEFDIQGQGRIDVWEGPSKDGWMLYADVRPEAHHAVIKNNDYVTVDESTPRGVWIPLHVTVKIPNDGTEYRVFIRGYPTAGATSFDQMSAMPNLKLAFRQKDARYIIGQLVAHAQDPEFEKDDLNIQAYGPAAGVLLQKEYPWKEHIQVSTAIDDIVRASFGPDANMLYTATRRLLTVYPKQGLQTGLTFATDGYVGDATIVAFSAPLDGDDVVTTAYVQSSWSGGGMTEYVVREPRGDIPVMESLFHAEQDAPTSTVASQGRSAVAYGRSSTVSRVVMSNADTTMLMGEVHIGDVVWIEAHSERVDAAGAYRIIQIDLDPDNDQYAYDVSPSD